MRKLLVTAFLSLDGVVQAPGGADEDRDGGFACGGWAVPHFDEQLIRRMADLTEQAEVLLLGRKTYEIFAEAWPLAAADDPIGAKLNSMPKRVASRTLKSVSWQNSALLAGDVVEAVRALKRDGGGEIQVHGSGQLVQTLLRHDLVDEFHLLFFPVLVGSGKRLFAGGTVPAGLRLVESETSATGVLIGRYARHGDLELGSMGPETGNW
ncbi:dihydrofolate reductase family protein [Saccharopolyspora taberi]|uniref:Dihydrofolate reductase family protein n=1 Tax=Saccharopolyspora taberi TaxID=60895 RepID=A0ABN3V3T7_9PSEU